MRGANEARSQNLQYIYICVRVCNTIQTSIAISATNSLSCPSFIPLPSHMDYSGKEI